MTLLQPVFQIHVYFTYYRITVLLFLKQKQQLFFMRTQAEHEVKQLPRKLINVFVIL